MLMTDFMLMVAGMLVSDVSDWPDVAVDVLLVMLFLSLLEVADDAGGV